MNKHNSPCEESLEYSFTDCVKARAIRETGCTPTWNEDTDKFSRNCNNLENLEKYEDYFGKLYYMDPYQLMNMTGCLTPCTYQEYEIVGTEDMNKGINNFGIFMSSAYFVVEKEVLAYTWITFLAEFGGALGLFLGFSFLMIWDLLEWIITFYQQRLCS